MHMVDEVQMYNKDSGLLLWTVDVRTDHSVPLSAWTILEDRTLMYAITSGDRIVYWCSGSDGEPQPIRTDDHIDDMRLLGR